MLKIWGRLTSVNVQKVVWCADELGLDYKRVDAGGTHGLVNTPEYRALNPNGLIPVIEDDGFVLWESNAIVRYLAAKYGHGSLWPTDIQIRADADRWVKLPLARETHAHVERWYASLQNRAGASQVIQLGLA